MKKQTLFDGKNDPPSSTYLLLKKVPPYTKYFLFKIIIIKMIKEIIYKISYT